MNKKSSNCQFGKFDITPKFNTELYPLDGVKHTTKAFTSRLECNFIIFEVSRTALFFLLSLDLIWINKRIKNSIQVGLEKKLKKEIQLVITTTHTHASPNISTDNLNSGDAKYEEFLVNEIIAFFNHHHLCYKTCKVSSKKIRTDFSVSRRKKVLTLLNLLKFNWKGNYRNRPNYKTKIYEFLSVFKFFDEQDELIGILINYPSHPTLYRESMFDSDFPGSIRRQVNDFFDKEIPILFLQGFSGDIKPNITENLCKKSFKNLLNFPDCISFKKKHLPEEINNFSQKISNHVITENGNSEKQMIYASNKEDILKIKIKDTSYEVSISLFKLNNELKFLCFGAEVLNSIEYLIRKKDAPFFLVSCANGMFGYIYDSNKIPEGGYEIDRANQDFGIVPGYFLVEENLNSLISRL